MRRGRIRQNRVLLLYLLILILRIHGKPNQMLAGRPVDVLDHRPARPKRRQGSQGQERHARVRRAPPRERTDGRAAVALRSDSDRARGIRRARHAGFDGRRALHAFGGRSGRRAVRHTSLDRRAGATDTGRSRIARGGRIHRRAGLEKGVRARRRRSDIQLYAVGTAHADRRLCDGTRQACRARGFGSHDDR